MQIQRHQTQGREETIKYIHRKIVTIYDNQLISFMKLIIIPGSGSPDIAKRLAEEDRTAIVTLVTKGR